MDHHADDLAALLDHLGVPQATVAGLSMGGYVAFALWRRHADRVRALALVDTRADPDSSQAQVARNTTSARVRETGVAAYADEMLPKLLASENLSNPSLATRTRKIMASQPIEGIVAALGALRDRPDSRPTLPTIRVPVMVMVGEHDAVTPPADAEAMAASIPDARFAVIPKAGHLSPLENPRRVNRLLREFVGALPAE
jgi:pimeloyl-ACP methyl ester carboxylesterase